MMNRINVAALENVNGGTHEELVDLVNALGLPKNIVDARMDEIEETLFYKHKICAWLYCYDCQNNFYRHADTDEVLTHSQVLAMIG